MTLIEVKLYAPLSGNVVTSLIIVTVLSILAIVIGRKVDKLGPRETPKGFLFAVVLIVDTFNKFIKDNLPGDRFRLFGAYLFTILIYLMVGNTISLFGLNPPQANLGVAMAHSIITFTLIKFAEIRYQGVKKKLVSLLGPVLPISPLMLPINLIGEFSTPLTMSMRLFGNLMSGVVISTMVYTALHWVGGIFAGVVVHAIFDVFFGLIQAFVYFMLSLVTISMASDA
jgi:F-type H+-transporting ATPase subunit a